jgi:ribosomal protein S18 acetylase RimI-like enzyme
MTDADTPAVAALQPLAFPPPFPAEFHWDAEDLLLHLERFPEGQWVAESPNGDIVGGCSNTRVTEATYARHANWMETVGGPGLEGFAPDGSTLYGIDITVHPAHRRLGIGRAFYAERFGYVRSHRLARYATACRLPDYRSYDAAHGPISVKEYANRVVANESADRTLTPLLRMGLTFIDVLTDYMEDWESANAAALLEWVE